MSNALTRVRLNKELPNLINAVHKSCLQAAGAALEHAMRCGDLLTEAKGACEHGEWSSWLAEHFDGSSRSARSYMQLASHRELLESKRQSSATLSIDGALRLIATGRDEKADEPADTEPTMTKEQLANKLLDHDFMTTASAATLAHFEHKNIPSSVFVEHGVDCQDDEVKTILDGYETFIYDLYVERIRGLLTSVISGARSELQIPGVTFIGSLVKVDEDAPPWEVISAIKICEVFDSEGVAGLWLGGLLLFLQNKIGKKAFDRMFEDI